MSYGKILVGLKEYIFTCYVCGHRESISASNIKEAKSEARYIGWHTVCGNWRCVDHKRVLK